MLLTRVQQFFTAWIVIAFVYLWFTLIVGGFYPLVDGGWRKIVTVIKFQSARKTTKESSEQPDSPASEPVVIALQTGSGDSKAIQV